MARERVLVFAPGTMPREASYFLPESPGVLETTNLAPIALVKLAKNVHGKEYPDRVVALCTKRAIDETLETIESGFSELDIAVEPHKVPDGKDENELKEIVRILLQAIPDECDLTLDITHGFRSSPFVFSVAAQYLSFLRPSVTIEGLYYGMLRNTPPDSPDAAPLAPLVDMSVLLELMDWVYAVRVFRDTYMPQKLADMMKQAQSSDEVEGIIESITRFADAFELGLPIELAERAVDLRKQVSPPLPETLESTVLLPDELFGEVSRLAAGFAPDRGDRVPDTLTWEEIRRQARVIDRYIEAGHAVNSVGMMREWVMLMVIYHNGDRDKWRTREERKGAEDLANRGRWASRELRKIKERVWELRNNLYHHGHEATDNLDVDQVANRAQRVWADLRPYMTRLADWKIEPWGY
jgi:CRISPR-associated DxTHG motif protein